MAESGIMRVKEGGGFAITGEDGFPAVYEGGKLILPGDPIIKSHGEYLEPVETGIEQATAAPGQKRKLRLPERHTVKSVTEPRSSHADKKQGENMAHPYPPEDPRSPASTFAPAQPGAGVVADDVPDEQNQTGAPKASDQTEQDVKDKEKADKEAKDQAEKDNKAEGQAQSQPQSQQSQDKPAGQSQPPGRTGSK